MIDVSIIFSLLSLLIFSRIIYLRWFHPLAPYPGPFIASFTNLWRFATFFTWHHHTIEQRLHAKYGLIVRVGPNSLSFSTLEAFEAIYGVNQNFIKGPWYNAGNDMRTGEGSIFNLRGYAEHKERAKQVVGRALGGSKVREYKATIGKGVEGLVADIKKMQATERGEKQRVACLNVAEVIHRFTLETNFKVVFGEPLLHDNSIAKERASKDARKRASTNFGIAWLPWLSYLTTSRIGRSIIQRPKRDSAGNLVGLSAVIAQIFKRVPSVYNDVSITEMQPYILGNLVQPSKGEDGPRLSQHVVQLESLNFFFAGPRSTAAGLTSVLYYLGRSEGQAWQSRIRNEGAKGNDQQSASALTAVIKETLRLHAPFPSAFPRDAARDLTASDVPGINGVLPIGTTVSCNLFVMGRSRELWGADADEWKPERWTKPSGEDSDRSAANVRMPLESLSEKDRRVEDKFLSFGKGPRSCIGKEIAFTMIGEAVTVILDKWNIEALGDLEGKNGFAMQYDVCKLRLTESQR